jgi:hypothetical protein
VRLEEYTSANILFFGYRKALRGRKNRHVVASTLQCWCTIIPGYAQTSGHPRECGDAREEDEERSGEFGAEEVVLEDIQYRDH